MRPVPIYRADESQQAMGQPGMRSVWAFEPHKRSAWHFHTTTDALPRFLCHKSIAKPSYEVLTLLWHEVIGDVQFDFCGPFEPGKEWPVAMVSGGTINVDVYTRKTKKKQHADSKAFSWAKMAAYISKYLTKQHSEGLEGRRMWDSTQDLRRLGNHVGVS